MDSLGFIRIPSWELRRNMSQDKDYFLFYFGKMALPGRAGIYFHPNNYKIDSG
jgi:hypothetical protein